MEISAKRSERLNYEPLWYRPLHDTQYKNETAKGLSQQQPPTNSQKRWTNINNTNIKPAHKILGLKTNQWHNINSEFWLPPEHKKTIQVKNEK